MTKQPKIVKLEIEDGLLDGVDAAWAHRAVRHEPTHPSA